MMPWMFLFAASLLEIVWAFTMKRSEGFTRVLPTLLTVLAMLGSFSLLSISMRTLPLSTAYTAWTGIGAVGTFIVGAVALSEPLAPGRVVGAGLVLAGLAFLTLSTAR